MSESISLVYGVPYTVEDAFEEVTKYNQDSGKPYRVDLCVGRDFKIGSVTLRFNAGEDPEFLDTLQAYPTENWEGSSSGGILGIPGGKTLYLDELHPGSIPLEAMQESPYLRAEVVDFFKNCNVPRGWYVCYS
jgi:hypothetical protein